MGGVARGVNDFMSSDWGWVTGPLKLGYETTGGKEAYAGLGSKLGLDMGGPKAPGAPPPSPDQADEAVRNARLMERRRQLGLMGRMSTFLTTAQGEQAPATGSTLLGG